MNLYGYPGLFRQLLFEPPPWIEVEFEDCEVEIDEERALELRPLYLQCVGNTELMRQQFEEHLHSPELQRVHFLDMAPSEQSEAILALMTELFCEKIDLANLIGIEGLEALPDAVFDDIPGSGYWTCAAKPGAPDLFLWHPDKDRNLWFFAEVKGPGDRLRTTQTEWLREHWNDIDGRFVLIIID